MRTGTRKSDSGWIVLLSALITLILADHLFDIPGLIARHHQGNLGKIFGAWLTWSIATLSAVVSGYCTFMYTKNWLRFRSAAGRVEENVS